MRIKDTKNLFYSKIKTNKGIIISLFVIFLIVYSSGFYYYVKTDSDKKIYKDYFSSNQRLFELNLQKNLNFAGEIIPQIDFKIKESADQAFLLTATMRSSMALLITKSNRWFPVIGPILKKNGIPDDIKYIALAESRLTNAISPQKATGFWQIMELTAKNYGLEVSEEVDERYSVEKSTQAACQYFKEAHKKFGNWTLAIASYNLGMGGIEAQLKKQKVTNYYNLVLNKETGRYVYRIIALKSIIENPKLYGIILRENKTYHKIETKTLIVDSSISNLTDFAIMHGYNYKILKIFNPWLRKTKLSNLNKKKYAIIFPKKKHLDIELDELEYDLLREPLILTDTTAIEPIKANSGTVHVVNNTDSWQSIAKKYNVKKEEIFKWNQLDEKTEIKVGMELLISSPRTN